MFNPKDLVIDALIGGVGGAFGYWVEGFFESLANKAGQAISEDGIAIEDSSSGQSSDLGMADINCANSFSADTKVDTSKGETSIKDVKIGDHVLAYNEESNSTGWYRVTNTIIHKDKTIVHLVLDDEKITTTPEHPFYTKEKGWVNASDLKTEMHVRKADGTYGVVQSVSSEDAPREMYNLTVDTAHTYFVGNGQWLVHNACPPLPGEIGTGRNTGKPLNGEKGIYEFVDQKTGKWYVGSAFKDSLFERLSGRVKIGIIKDWDSVVWTEIEGNERAIRVAERIRIEQIADMVGGRQNMVNDLRSNPASQQVVINWFAEGWYKNVPGWPTWLTNPWP